MEGTEDAPPGRRVLFLCTGNFYRSRFAEAVFNHHARREGLGWSAFSRGLALDRPLGPLSPYTAKALAARSIDLCHTGPGCVRASQEDLARADLIVALSEREHRPMVRNLFPELEARTLFWEVADVDLTSAEDALPRIEALVLELLSSLPSRETVPGEGGP